METYVKVGLGIGAFVLVCGVTTCGTVVSTNNSCVRQEQGLKAQYTQNQNNYDNYFKKLKEVCQVPEMYASDLKSVYQAAIQGRYGPDGSKAVFSFIKEHNPSFDASLYKQIQQVIEAGRNDFETNQKLLIDKKRVYETYLGEFPSGTFAMLLGFPKMNLDDIKIITSVETDAAFKSGQSAPIQLR